MYKKLIFIAIATTGLLTACDSKPKVIVADDTTIGMEQPISDEASMEEPPAEGISLAELFANRKKYEGKAVQVKGKCVKVNNMIMNRNWIHLQDGSLKDEESDLTVTTTENIALGAIVAFEGIITLNKDFGAGYKYEIIMEEARLLK